MHACASASGAREELPLKGQLASMPEVWWISAVLAGFWLSFAALVYLLWRGKHRMKKRKAEDFFREMGVTPPPAAPRVLRESVPTLKDLERRYGKKG